ncbi:hypothetical protein TIFTF001_024852 [Ficus carica]|uniref:Uncharacterized protein n=1 Tax=Ficus carica TaxID=3494 RepID=A0AA88AHL9_FICCA|nr:hypothetical protein TIFTF001_024852 [Ficus carica]
MKMNSENITSFDMSTLKTNLPLNRKGLSRYYSGKSRSFTCMEEVHSVEDLKKLEHSDAKKRKKYSERNKELLDNVIPSYPCRRISSTNQCDPPCVGV